MPKILGYGPHPPTAIRTTSGSRGTRNGRAFSREDAESSQGVVRNEPSTQPWTPSGVATSYQAIPSPSTGPETTVAW